MTRGAEGAAGNDRSFGDCYCVGPSWQDCGAVGESWRQVGISHFEQAASDSPSASDETIAMRGRTRRSPLPPDFVRILSTPYAPYLEHDPEKWQPVFGKDHAQIKLERNADPSYLIPLWHNGTRLRPSCGASGGARFAARFPLSYAATEI
jgi:hypothetical protein